MKSLFIVSAAFGIFSGTSISAKAQTAVNYMRLNDATALVNSPKFIEGIEIKRATAEIAAPVVSTVLVKAKLKNDFTSKFGSTIEECSQLQFKYALLMNVEVETISNVALYNYIEDWYGTRYRYGGTSKKGVDCSWFAGTLMTDVFGFNMPRTARAQYEICEKIVKENLLEGDMVFFNTRGGVSHVGVYLGNGYFVHSGTSNGVTISSLEDNYYKSKLICGGRVNQ